MAKSSPLPTFSVKDGRGWAVKLESEVTVGAGITSDFIRGVLGTVLDHPVQLEQFQKILEKTSPPMPEECVSFPSGFLCSNVQSHTGVMFCASLVSLLRRISRRHMRCCLTFGSSTLVVPMHLSSRVWMVTKSR